MPIDELAVIEAEAERIRAAYAADPQGTVPWSDRWTVGTVARHVAGLHHVVSQIVADRPTAGFDRFETLDAPAKGDPGFPDWFAAGTATVVAQLRSTPADEATWSWHPDEGSVGWWSRRLAHETLVHRWDAEAGAGITGPPMDPAVAADGIDELLDVFVSASRALHNSPAGPTVAFRCTDTGPAAADWYLDLSQPGARSVSTTGPVSDEVAVTLSGPAEDLLLVLWGRVPLDATAVTLTGDESVFARWTDLVPPM
jgi:uncharacterized protein (TIGR03083 family)